MCCYTLVSIWQGKMSCTVHDAPVALQPHHKVLVCLQVELEWMLEDVVGGRNIWKALTAASKSLSDDDRQQCGPKEEGTALSCRLTIPQLDALWARRFAGRHDWNPPPPPSLSAGCPDSLHLMFMPSHPLPAPLG